MPLFAVLMNNKPSTALKITDSLNYLQRDLRRVFRLFWNAAPLTALINLCLQCILALLPVVSLYFIKALIEALVKGSSTFNALLLPVLGFAAVQFLLALAGQYANYVSAIHQEALTDHLSAQVLEKAITVDYNYYETPAYHDTLHLAQLQSLYKAPALLANFNSLILNSLSLFFLLGFFFTMHSFFALLFMLLSVPLAIIKWYSGFELLRLERKFSPIEREAGYLHDTLTSVTYAKEARVLGFGAGFIKKFNYIRQNIRQAKKTLQAKLTLYSLLAEAVEIVVMTLIFITLARYAWEKVITIGVFVIYIQGFQRLQVTSKNFLQSVVHTLQQRIFLQDLFTFLDMPASKSAQSGTAFPQAQMGLSVQNVSFTYPGTEREVLHQVSVNCPAGNIIAIVGQNGSGKSTLVKLLARLYELQAGTIQIDGVPIDNIGMSDFRAGSIFLFQDFEKYFLSINENIALGEQHHAFDAQRAQNAAKLAGAHDFITQLSQGYQTRMGRLFDGGEQISGGQWQKLALSRLFYKQAQLIVLDEPTSAIDAVAELEIFNNLKANSAGKMIIIVTHRLYNLKIADHIYVMNEGRIAEDGDFDTLVKKGGIFTAMHKAQKL